MKFTKKKEKKRNYSHASNSQLQLNLYKFQCRPSIITFRMCWDPTKGITEVASVMVYTYTYD